ncbi:MAG: Rieske 2Fe-2S domain-containing protein [Dehalococcoidia bacterium]
MVQSERQTRQRVRVAVEEQTPAETGRIPKLSGDIRHLIPKLGLRNYWYPALAASRVGNKKPVQVKMLGEEIAFFRGVKGNVVAITDICPHRGARLGEGDCHFAGTVACPYHGWVWDEHGQNVAVLAEGPDSTVCGKPGTEAKTYPTRTLKGVVFVWIGDDEPAPIEEDVPEEFFDSKAYIFFNDQILWKTNWEVGLENSMDSHVGYLHRDALTGLLTAPTSGARPAQGSKIAFTGNGFRGVLTGPNANFQPTPQDVYPNGWKWPKHQFRTKWNWFFKWFFTATRVPGPPAKSIRWSGGHRLPGMFRAGGFFVQPPGANGSAPAPVAVPPQRRGPNGLFGFYTRQTVPVEEWLTRVWYFHYTRPESKRQLTWFKMLYYGMYRWLSEYNFSQQDMSVMLHQKYDWPEKLSGTDAEVVQWRKLVVTKAYGGRNAAFEFRSTDGLSPDEAPDANMFADNLAD